MGSDLDLIAVVRDSTAPFTRRAAAWDATGLPVPAELLVYTLVEWERLRARGGRFAQMVRSETEWLVQ